jgi:rare lipoprotein A
MTAAHPWLPFGTRIRVTHVSSGRSIVVVVNDRLPSKRRVLDLSLGAAKALGMIRQGVAAVEITLA